MDLYALQGVAQRGKTTTLKDLIDILKQHYPNANPIVNTAHGDDMTVILKNLKGHTVGIETAGDTKDILDASFKVFAAQNCDIIFCACRTKQGTVVAVNGMNPPYNIHFVKKVVEQNSTLQPVKNRQQADAMRIQAGL